MFDVPNVSYARSGGVAVAYQVVGDGPVDVVYAPHLTNLFSLWLGGYSGPFLRRLAEDVRVIVFNPRGTGLSDRPRNVTLEARMDDINAVLDAVGIERAMTEFSRAIDPAIAEDPKTLDWFVWMHRLSASPTAAADFARMTMETDITDVLGSIRVPTLILHREAQRGEAHYMAERIPGANATELQGGSRGPYSTDVVEALLSFVRGTVASPIPAELGDSDWRALLTEHQRLVRRELSRHRGVEIDTAGDGFFCRFDGPARAIACARAVVEDARSLDLEVRAGVHTGECEVVGDKIAGIAVHVGARVAASAGPGEVLVSGTVKDLVAGSGFTFDDRGEHELKGVPGSWRLFSVVA